MLWPASVRDAYWRDSSRMATIRFKHRLCSFALSCKNDVTLRFTGINSDAILGVEMKRALDDQVGPGLVVWA